jgi:hypothetical protein
MAKFIYGGTTGETPETIARKREMAMALVANQGTPRDIGEGLNAIGDALLARRMYKGAGRAEEAGRASAPKFGFDPVMSALTRQSPAVSGGNRVMAALDPKAPASIEERMGGRPFDAVREALIKQESGGNPNAISPKGAVGVTQVMPDTAMDPGFGVPSVFDIAQAKGIQVASRDKATAIELLKNPAINEELGGKYFDAMANRYGGNLDQAAAAYNGGPGRLDSVGGNIGRMPAETQAYVPAVTGGQPQQVAQAGGGMFDPEVYNQAMAVLQHPFADPQSKAAAQAYVEQAQRQADPKYQLEVRKLEKDVADDGRPWWVRPDNTVDPAYLEAERAGATNVNVGEGDKFYENLDKKNAESFAAMSDAGVAARQKLINVDELEGLLANAPQGAEGAWKALAGEYGIATEGLSDIQAATALINQIVPTQRLPGSGPMSDADLALFKQSVPRILNQPGGNAKIIQTMRGIAQYEAQMGEIADLVADRAISPQEARKRIRELKNPLERVRQQPASTPAPAPDTEDADALTDFYGAQ